MTEKEKKRITDMRRSRAGYAEIADATGISVNTIKTFCRRNGLSDAALAEKVFCKNCGCAISRGKYRPKKFCSDHCRMDWWNAHLDKVHKTAFYSFICRHCGKSFTAYGNAQRKYCCRDCYLASRRGKEVSV